LGPHEGPIAFDGAAHLPWKPDEPSKDPLKACVAFEFQRKKEPYLQFFKENCNANRNAITQSIGPPHLDGMYKFMAKVN
jgi:hypothetical protein